MEDLYLLFLPMDKAVNSEKQRYLKRFYREVGKSGTFHGGAQI